MNDIKIAVLGSEGVGKSALIVRFLTRRFIGEYASSSECIYRKCLSVDGRQVHLELYDPCSQACEGKSALNDQIHWADGFILVYDISDRSSFLTAKAIVHLIRELHLGSAKKGLAHLFGGQQTGPVPNERGGSARRVSVWQPSIAASSMSCRWRSTTRRWRSYSPRWCRTPAWAAKPRSAGDAPAAPSPWPSSSTTSSARGGNQCETSQTPEQLSVKAGPMTSDYSFL
uniref:small monomeric GTPase n=1 Tax=Seriola dumerili TaxID=41447 RepID=A0A3B4V4E1_SERDU